MPPPRQLPASERHVIKRQPEKGKRGGWRPGAGRPCLPLDKLISERLFNPKNQRHRAKLRAEAISGEGRFYEALRYWADRHRYSGRPDSEWYAQRFAEVVQAGPDSVTQTTPEYHDWPRKRNR